MVDRPPMALSADGAPPTSDPCPSDGAAGRCDWHSRSGAVRTSLPMNVLLSTTLFPGSLYYRMSEPARAVNDVGLGVEVTVQRGVKTTMARSSADPDAPAAVQTVDAQGADVVVLQLPKTREMLDVLRLLQGRGVAVVVEMDDLLSAVPPGHRGHDVLVRKGVARVAAACAQEADFVTVSTPALL